MLVTYYLADILFRLIILSLLTHCASLVTNYESSHVFITPNKKMCIINYTWHSKLILCFKVHVKHIWFGILHNSVNMSIKNLSCFKSLNGGRLQDGDLRWVFASRLSTCQNNFDKWYNSLKNPWWWWYCPRISKKGFRMNLKEHYDTV